jgi:hypothetical protein
MPQGGILKDLTQRTLRVSPTRGSETQIRVFKSKICRYQLPRKACITTFIPSIPQNQYKRFMHALQTLCTWPYLFIISHAVNLLTRASGLQTVPCRASAACRTKGNAENFHSASIFPDVVSSKLFLHTGRRHQPHKWQTFVEHFAQDWSPVVCFFMVQI